MLFVFKGAKTMETKTFRLYEWFNLTKILRIVELAPY